MIKAEEFKDLHPSVKSLIRDVRIGHLTTPDNFNNLKCVVTNDNNDGGLQYSLEGSFSNNITKSYIFINGDC